jgi:hypothetical protein
MLTVFLLHAMKLLGRYAELYANCKCCDKIERVRLFSDTMNFADEVEKFQKEKKGNA